MARKHRKERVGDVLGLGDTASSSMVNAEPGPRHASEAERRRARMSEGADELTPTASETTPQHGSGATGIDMGSGGEGTDLE